MTDRLIAYIGATVLNPYHKWQWFDRSWTTPNLLPALLRGKADLRQLWEDKYAGVSVTVRPTAPRNNGGGEINGFAAYLFRITAAPVQRAVPLNELE